MNFRTEIEAQQSPVKIDLNDKILTIGSCFSEVVGGFLNQNKFQVLNNPFGTVYNPISIFKLLKLAAIKELPDPHGYLQQGEVHYHYDYHSDISALSKPELEKQIEHKLSTVHEALKVSDWLIITFGTVVAYQRKSNGDLVANCHKVPQQEFSRDFLSLDKIKDGFRDCYSILKGLNEDLKLMVTVSPVRHTKETLSDNSFSKALLRVFCQEVTRGFEDVTYFPSYEIMMDDLRDYRYYSDDLIHPTKAAEDYIFEKFSNTFFDSDTLQLLKDWSSVRQALNHKPKHPETLAHLKFLEATLSSMVKLSQKLDLNVEINKLKDQIDSLTSG